MNESTLVPREECESGLDWLARVLHKWPDGGGITLLGRGCSFFDTGVGRSVHVYAVDGSDYTTIKEKDWLARRAELQEKPSWAHAPEWAEYMAQSPNGHWEFFAVKPRAKCWWRHPIGERSSANSASIRGAILGDWRDTLEKRPEQTIADICREVTGENRHEEIFEPFVSVEDAKITIMQSEGDVKHSGGIIGRSLPLEEDAATAKQPAPKGSGNPILGMVLADLANRALEGKEKYGEPLLAHNGRNPLWDAYQEALGLAMYLRQAIEEQK